MDRIFGVDKLIVLFVVILIIIIAVAVGISLSGDDDPSDGNGGNGTVPRWEDLRIFKSYLYNNYSVEEKTGFETEIVTQIEDPSDALWLILGVEKEFSSEEASALRNFVDRGGSVVVASDSTYANKLSLQFGVEYTSYRILETERYDKNEYFIPMEAYMGGTSYNIITNGPLYLDPNENVTTIDIEVVAASSGWSGMGDFSFIDKNSDGIAGKEDVIDQFPAIVEVHYGEGKIIFMSDTGIFTDDLWDLSADYENSEFCKDLLKYTVSRQGTVIYDLSKHENYQSGHKLYPR